VHLNKEIITNILEYCKINDIKDSDEIINKCLITGFNILKYGTSPIENMKKANKKKMISPEKISKEEKDIEIKKEEEPVEEKKIVKRKVKIIRTDSKEKIQS
jgi:hypothetical protein